MNEMNDIKIEISDDVKIGDGKEVITMEYARANFEEVLTKIDLVVRDASLKILDAHNKAMLEYEIDLIANKIRSNIGDNIAFEIFMSGLYSEFNAKPTPDIAEMIICKLRTSKYYMSIDDN